MGVDRSNPEAAEYLEIDLRQPGWAAFWAWLWPGAGHLYQGRRAKGLLLMICILSTYFFGLSLSGGHAVYASWTETDKRWQFFFQAGVGLPAMPALVQYALVKEGKAPLAGRFMAPPKQPVLPEQRDQLARWHERYHWLFEMSMLYTMIAGLLNVLAIYDAWAGPMGEAPEEESAEKAPPDAGRRRRLFGLLGRKRFDE